jgi:tetratricopeptide (TPR) repeat protein
MSASALLLAVLAAFPGGDVLERAETLLAAGKPAEARSILEERLAGDAPAAEKARLFEAEARCLRAEGRPWDAEAAFGSALEVTPAYYEAAIGRGEVFMELAAGAAGGDRPTGSEVRALAADARRWLEAAAGIRPGDPRALRSLARARILDLDFGGAAESIRSLLEKAPKDAGLQHLLAEAMRGAGDRAGAAKAEAAALAIDPALPDAAARRVSDIAAGGDPGAARAAALEALASDPGAEGVYLALWELDAPEKRYDALEDVLARVIALHPDQPNPKALHYLAYAQFSAGRRDAALETFRRKAGLEPRNPDTRLQIGRLLVGKGSYDEAEKSFEEALAFGLEPGSVPFTTALEGLASIGGAHGQARRYAEAERVFRRLAGLDPRSSAYRLYHGLSLRRLGRYEESEKEYLAAVDLAPFDGSPHNELGLLYLGWGRAAEARKAFEESAAEDPRITSPLENLGNLARVAGRKEESLTFFREACRRATEFRAEDDRLKFRRYLDAVACEGGTAPPAVPPVPAGR